MTFALALAIILQDRFTLDNGLTVVLHRVARQDMVAVGIAYRTGVMKEPADRTGLAHLVEHLVVRSATESFKPGESERLLQASGVTGQPFTDANAETSHDFTYFYSMCREENLEQALRIEAERMRTARFTPELLDEERSKALLEVDYAAKNQPAFQRAMELTYAKLRYRLPKVGTVEGMRASTVEEARSFYDSWYHPNNAVLVVLGNFDPDKAKAIIQARFGPISRGKLPAFEPPEEPDALGERAILAGEPRQIVMTWLSAPPESRERAAVMLGVYRLLVASARISELSQNVYIYDDALVLGRSAVTMTAILKPGTDVDEALTTAHDWIEKLGAKPMAPDKLEECRVRLRNELGANEMMSLGFVPKNDTMRYAQLLGQLAINRLRREIAGAARLDRLLEEASKTTAEEVQAAARKYLSKDRANVVIFK